jgi:hypothetical protein
LFCISCGSPITEADKFCNRCGKTLGATEGPSPYPQPDEAGIAKSVKRYISRHPIVSVVVILACVFAVVRLLASLANNTVPSPSGGVTVITGQAKPPAVATVPPLQFSYSRRLPIKLHSFQLGMSIADALNSDSNIAYLDSSKGKPAASDRDASLVDKLSDGFFVMMSFPHGRLVYISSDVGSLSPDDAQSFDTNTLELLGPPTVDVYEGSDRKTLVWIDGDVRLKYTNRPGGGLSRHGPTAPRIVTLEMCVYPQMQKDPSLDYEWGNTSAPVVHKPLPEGIGGLRLRQSPWELRQAVPGIDITTISEQEAKGEYKTPDYVLGVKFWRGHVKSFCEYWSTYQFQRYVVVRDQSLKLWGTPGRRWDNVSHSGVEMITWDDGHTDIEYSWTTGSGNAGTSFSRCWSDIELSQLSDSGGAEQYKTAPMTKSFF